MASGFSLYSTIKTGSDKPYSVTGTLVAGDKFAMDVKVSDAVTGSFTPSGLTVEGHTECFPVTTTASLVPPTALTGRNHILVHNTSETDILYVGFSASVIAARTTGPNSGKEVYPGEEWGVDITDDILLYGIVASGSVQIKTTELA